MTEEDAGAIGAAICAWTVIIILFDSWKRLHRYAVVWAAISVVVFALFTLPRVEEVASRGSAVMGTLTAHFVFFYGVHFWATFKEWRTKRRRGY